jgi:endogenous inhibitor of DNA gyrase (YacG/DUF329 family)
MKIKVKCAICGKDGEVEIDEIKSDWAYFGKMTFGRKTVDYWECPECSNDDRKSA